MSAPDRPAPLTALLAITFLGSVSGGAFWTGLFFVTARRYDFSAELNLTLAAVMGGAYALAAFKAGGLLRRLEKWVSPRAVLAASLVAQAVAALGPVWIRHTAVVVWPTALLGVLSAAVTWPIVESYLAAGRHGPAMRSAIGWFNVAWTPAVALPLLMMPLLARWDLSLTIGIAAVVNVLALPLLAALPRKPGHHDLGHAQAAQGREYPHLLRSAGLLLPLSYVLSSTLSPVLPHRVEAVGVGADLASVVGATWMLARFVTLVVMWRLAFWHGRWSVLSVGAGALVLGLGAVLLAPGVGWLLTGLVLFGVGMALIYYAALYYSMAVGHAAVDAGGAFEGLIGLGYLCGPMVGLAGQALGGPAHRGPATVALAWGVVTLAAYPALRPYLGARRQRPRR